MAILTPAADRPQPPSRWSELSPTLRARLEREGITTPQEWLAAGRRRRLIFGVSARQCDELDAIAREPVP